MLFDITNRYEKKCNFQPTYIRCEQIKMGIKQKKIEIVKISSRHSEKTKRAKQWNRVLLKATDNQHYRPASAI